MENHTRPVHPSVLGAISARVAKLNERIARKGLGEPVTMTVGPRYSTRDDLTGVPRWWNDVTISFTRVALPGSWTLTALADWSATDEPLIFHFGDDLDSHEETFDRARCDHCGTRRRRSAVFVVEDPDGARLHVGRTCLADFLGHNVTGLLSLPQLLDFEDDEFWSAGPLGQDVPVVDFVAAAAVAVRVWGWHKASEVDATPTRQNATDLVFGRLHPHPGDLDGIRALELLGDPLTSAQAEAAVKWAQEMEPRGDFERNLRAVARSAYIGPKAFGVAAYLPVAYARHLDQEAEREAAPTAPALPCPEGRVEIEGVVTSFRAHDNGYQTVLKMTVAADDGWRVWVTCPAAIEEQVERGDRVRFTATVTRSDDDETFGWAKRPTRADVVATREA